MSLKYLLYIIKIANFKIYSSIFMIKPKYIRDYNFFNFLYQYFILI